MDNDESKKDLYPWSARETKVPEGIYLNDDLQSPLEFDTKQSVDIWLRNPGVLSQFEGLLESDMDKVALAYIYLGILEPSQLKLIFPTFVI